MTMVVGVMTEKGVDSGMRQPEDGGMARDEM